MQNRIAKICETSLNGLTCKTAGRFSFKKLRNVSEEKFEFKRSLLVFGNLMLLLWILLGAVSFWFYDPLFFWLFLLFAAFTVFAMLRRIGCSSCAYCRSCTSGFGRLSGWFFGGRPTKDVNNRTGLAFVFFIYCLLALVPSVFLITSMIQAFAVVKALVFVLNLLISLYSLSTWARK